MECEHRMVYEGAVNVVINGEVDGVVDVWRCAKCGETAADMRRVGEPVLPDKVGMGQMGLAERWGIIACYGNGVVDWHLILTPGSMHHSCSAVGQCELEVDKDGNVRCDRGHAHKFYFISGHINSKVVIG